MTRNMEDGFLEPEKIVALFGIKKGDHIADFGAGHGYFTIPLARAAGGDGRVYAIDIQKPTLDIIRAKAGAEHLLNLEYIWADLDMPAGSHLKDKFCDFVLIADILFQAEDKRAVAQEAYRVLVPGGRLAMVEWNAALPTLSGVERMAPLGQQAEQGSRISMAHRSIDQSSDSGGMDSIRFPGGELGAGFGPPAQVRIKKEDARAAALQAGFQFMSEFSAGSHHYGLLFIKK